MCCSQILLWILEYPFIIDVCSSVQKAYSDKVIDQLLFFLHACTGLLAIISVLSVLEITCWFLHPFNLYDSYILVYSKTKASVICASLTVNDFFCTLFSFSRSSLILSELILFDVLQLLIYFPMDALRDLMLSVSGFTYSLVLINI